VITTELASSVWRIQRRIRGRPRPSRTAEAAAVQVKMVLQPARRAISSTIDLRTKLAREAACTCTTAGCWPKQASRVCQKPDTAPFALTAFDPSRWVAT
jgi:hypothetical protein